MMRCEEKHACYELTLYEYLQGHQTDMEHSAVATASRRVAVQKTYADFGGREALYNILSAGGLAVIVEDESRVCARKCVSVRLQSPCLCQIHGKWRRLHELLLGKSVFEAAVSSPRKTFQIREKPTDSAEDIRKFLHDRLDFPRDFEHFDIQVRPCVEANL